MLPFGVGSLRCSRVQPGKSVSDGRIASALEGRVSMERGQVTMLRQELQNSILASIGLEGYPDLPHRTVDQVAAKVRMLFK
jgi:hypothetical protein